MKLTALRCHRGCGTELAEPEFSVKPYLADMERGDPLVVYRINQGYSAAVWAANRSHLDACRGLPVVDQRMADQP